MTNVGISVMCGLVGFLQSNKFLEEDGRKIIERMAQTIAHRGPDASDSWVDVNSGIALAHRRLSVIDLSSAGNQPMHSACGRYVLVYNGEIYNHQELRLNLEIEGGACAWRGNSDTETLLAALRHWGVERALKRLNGMFAFALWDKIERVLFLARDRMGEKPLYYGHSDGVFLFGSELKALIAHPHWNGKVDRNALALYMRYRYIPSPWSIYEGIAKLPPAHFVAIRESDSAISEAICYWSLTEIATQGEVSACSDPHLLADELDSILHDAVKQRMMADVPLGAFLSGGYDSTTVVALMQSQSMIPVNTFSIGFFEQGYNEAQHAKAVAQHLGTNHAELYVTAEAAISAIPKLTSVYDEPFSDSSQIPTYLVSQLARSHVTVALSGDGGDELFYGYDRYFLAHRAWQKLQYFSPAMRHGIAWLLNCISGKYLDTIQKGLPQRLQISNLADRLPKISELLRQQDRDQFYQGFVSDWKAPCQIVLGGMEPETLFSKNSHLPSLTDMRARMMFLDMMTYLPDDILTKVDRASMAVSLEARVPLLDHRLVEFAWRVPLKYKHRYGQGKWLLKQVLYRYVPQELMDRPKKGFSVPIEHWLRGPLRDWAESLLSERRLLEDGFFDPTPIRQMWQEHLSNSRRWHCYLWSVLMFQSWVDDQRS